MILDFDIFCVFVADILSFCGYILRNCHGSIGPCGGIFMSSYQYLQLHQTDIPGCQATCSIHQTLTSLPETALVHQSHVSKRSLPILFVFKHYKHFFLSICANVSVTITPFSVHSKFRDVSPTTYLSIEASLVIFILKRG